jgi:hypothetical protein
MDQSSMQINSGAMFSAGLITWMSSTPVKNYDNDVAKITQNVVQWFLDPKPFTEINHNELKDFTRFPPNPEYEHMDQQ